MGFNRTVLVVIASWLLLAAPIALFFLTLRLAARSRKRFKTVFDAYDVERIWRWEIASGRYPSRYPIDIELGTHSHERRILKVENPAVPPFISNGVLPDLGEQPGPVEIIPVGPARFYLPPDNSVTRNGKTFLTRPKANAALDMDQVMMHCQFPKNYVKDCLAFLRGEAIDTTARRRLFLTEEGDFPPSPHVYADVEESQSSIASIIGKSDNKTFTNRLKARQQLTLAHTPPVSSELRTPHPTFPDADPACDPQHPRLLHMYWTGPFTDKPYMAAISFLYTQNLGLDLPFGSHPSHSHCRPQLWIWINPNSAANLMPAPDTEEKMQKELHENKWSAPLLNERWNHVVKFKLWNTTEQLDGVEELQGWRGMSIFKSHGYKYKNSEEKPNAEFSRLGSTDSSSYDRLSVVMSDMARFILLHRFGGLYIDADTVFLRDWEPLFSWRGSFAYRWSRLKLYNTAVLKLDRGSAIGHFVVKTSVENGFDFHPMSVAHYTHDAKMEGLLKMLPDALFDPAWLNTEKYQRDKPAQPYFQKFEEFFQPPKKDHGGPASLDNFFTGAFSYHYHNFWWLPFDSQRNYPDLDSRTARPALSTKEKATLSWSASLKRTFEAFVRGEEPNLYGERMAGLSTDDNEGGEDDEDDEDQ